MDIRYHMKDVIIGKIYFLLVRIKIKHMEVSLIRRETTGTGPNAYNESHTLTKFEIMDGAPVRGESIPVRIFLAGFDLTPSYRNIASLFSLKYYLNLVLVDEEDRRYFKQFVSLPFFLSSSIHHVVVVLLTDKITLPLHRQEVTIWRRA